MSLNSIAAEKVASSWILDAGCLIHPPVMSRGLRSGASLGKISAGHSDGQALSR